MIQEEFMCQDCGSYMLISREEWLDLFEEILVFPFEAEVIEYQESDYINQGDKVKVHNLLDEDDLYGVIVSIRKGRKKYDFPLVDLEPINVTRKIINLFDAYHYWFCNERYN